MALEDLNPLERARVLATYDPVKLQVQMAVTLLQIRDAVAPRKPRTAESVSSLGVSRRTVQERTSTLTVSDLLDALTAGELLQVPYLSVQLQRPSAVVHYNVTVSKASSPTELKFRGEVVWLILDNTVAGSQALSVSFDGKKNYKSFSTSQTLSLSPWTLPKGLRSVYYQSTVAGGLFEVLTGELI